MKLQSIDKVEEISAEDFKKNYYKPMKPLIITGLAKNWPAYKKWNWDYFDSIVGEVKVGLYNNIKSDAYTPINTADAPALSTKLRSSGFSSPDSLTTRMFRSCNF